MEAHLIGLLAGLGYDAAWLVGVQDAPLPYIRAQRVGGSGELTLDGATGRYDGRVQIDCYAPAFSKAEEMAKAVRLLLSGYSGGPITSARLQGMRDLADAPDGDVIQRVSLDFFVRWHD
jgi:hypothetical protein